eukprot:GAHX01000722.1.p1 GENE.GAHX01000722.1~~GAHX01000722.1.p1  ORF type:complete len:515 (+),score=93.31 GAHX01000722.1:36-1547(+)
MREKFCLIVIDGWGIENDSPTNAITSAQTPNMDFLEKGENAAQIKASGLAVGLPEGVMGNSEVGHLTIGAGRPLRTDIVRINLSIAQNNLKDNVNLSKLKNSDQDIHFVGLMSDASVHSNINHLFELVKIFRTVYKNKSAIYLHLITDGRDTAPTSAANYLKLVRKNLEGFDNIKIATLGGRFYYMDRDNRQERIDFALSAMLGDGEQTQLSPEEYIQQNYSNDITDEFIKPAIFNHEYKVKENDNIFFFNFRPDRMREIVTSFEARGKNTLHAMTSYSESLQTVNVIFETIFLDNCLSHILSQNNLKQVHIAETEKYAHVTYFFNGRNEEEIKGERRVLITSNKDVATYDLAPEMKMKEVADQTIKEIENNSESDVIILNFAAPDMVGHTGNLEAAIKACSNCDMQIGRVMKAAEANNWNLGITADHGNAEVMVNPVTGDKQTSHTVNDVPFFVVLRSGLKEIIKFKRKEGTLSDVAPTVLDVLGINESIYKEHMEGKSMFK